MNDTVVGFGYLDGQGGRPEFDPLNAARVSAPSYSDATFGRRSITIESGEDTLFEIAAGLTDIRTFIRRDSRFSNLTDADLDARLAQILAAFNHIDNLDRIRAGQEFFIPLANDARILDAMAATDAITTDDTITRAGPRLRAVWDESKTDYATYRPRITSAITAEISPIAAERIVREGAEYYVAETEFRALENIAARMDRPTAEQNPTLRAALDDYLRSVMASETPQTVPLPSNLPAGVNEAQIRDTALRVRAQHNEYQLALDEGNIRGLSGPAQEAIRDRVTARAAEMARTRVGVQTDLAAAGVTGTTAVDSVSASIDQVVTDPPNLGTRIVAAVPNRAGLEADIQTGIINPADGRLDAALAARDTQTVAPPAVELNGPKRIYFEFRNDEDVSPDARPRMPSYDRFVDAALRDRPITIETRGVEFKFHIPDSVRAEILRMQTDVRAALTANMPAGTVVTDEMVNRTTNFLLARENTANSSSDRVGAEWMSFSSTAEIRDAGPMLAAALTADRSGTITLSSMDETFTGQRLQAILQRNDGQETSLRSTSVGASR